MSTSEKIIRSNIVAIGRLMYENRWIAANDGNISARLENNRFLSTPTGVSKGLMSPEDLVVVNEDGKKIDGLREPTSEIAMHMTIYAERRDVNAVVHAHPPYATGFAVAGRALDLAIVPEIIINLGAIPLAEYGTPGTPELSRSLLPYLSAYDAVLLANHGAVTYGSDLSRAFSHMDTLEHVARIAAVAELLGGPRVLKNLEVDKLVDARGRYGVSSHLSHAVRPIAHEENEALQARTLENGLAARVRLRQVIGRELGLRFGHFLFSAAVKLHSSEENLETSHSESQSFPFNKS